jgi:LCP family protein required for cell wall assembly
MVGGRRTHVDEQQGASAVSGGPRPWGPKAREGDRRGRLRRLAWGSAIVGLAGIVAVAATGLLLYLRADGSLTRVPVDELDDPTERAEDADGDSDDHDTASTQARAFLVVGSDDRDDSDDREDVARGDVDGQRSDAILYVALSEDRERVSVLSLPRDLLVQRDGSRMRLGDTFQDGAGELVATLQEVYGLPVHHYAKVTFGGFIDAVDTLGGVELCLDDDLVDPDAGADLDAGCAHRSPEDALAFVRSRQGERADLERIERQQRFIRATLEELTERRVLADVPRLFDLVEDVAGNVTTDDRLGMREMLGLADELRDLVDDDLPMGSVPAYPETVGTREVLLPYAPGAKAIFERLRNGESLPDRGTPEQREETAIAIWSQGRADGADILASTLLFAGFVDRTPAGAGPGDLDVGDTTTIFAASSDDEAAERLAAVLGAPVRTLPDGVDLPDDADVAVAVGRDASTSVDLGARLVEPDDSIETQAVPGELDTPGDGSPTS